MTQGQDALERGQDGTRRFFQGDTKATDIYQALNQRSHFGECLSEQFWMVLSLLEEQGVEVGALDREVDSFGYFRRFDAVDWARDAELTSSNGCCEIPCRRSSAGALRQWTAISSRPRRAALLPPTALTRHPDYR